MSLFFATCPSGLEVPAARLASHEIKGFSAKQTLSGAVIFSAGDARPRGSAFQNVYLLLGKRDRSTGIRQAAEQFAADARALREADQQIRRLGFKTWRVMFSEANKLQPVVPALRSRFERAIRAARVDRMKPDTELLILRRSEGCAFLLLRLTRPTAQPKNVQKGELSPAIARSMVALASPRANGTFLDPFSGHGALGAARLSMGRAERVCLSEIDPGLTRRLQERFGAKADVGCLDALTLSTEYPEGAFTEIVTDPPWGIFEKLPMPENEFYALTIKQFEYLLAPRGTCVILTAAKDSLISACRGSALQITERFDLLVNGKKAGIFVLRKAK